MTDTALQVRSTELLEYREDSESGYIEGIGVPYGQTVTVYREDGSSFQERIEYGSMEPEGTVWLYNRHEDPIGVVEVTEHRSEGLWFRAKLALSDLALTAREQLINGAVKHLSVSFVPVEDREENGVIVRARARLREISVTPTPVYQLATVLHVREDITDREPITNQQEEPVSDNTNSNVDPIEVRELTARTEELEQRMSMLTVAPAPAAEKIETRSVGEIVKAIANGDEATTDYVNEVQNRAYTGGTTADSPIKDAWGRDLTDIFDASSGVLSRIFQTGALPETGMGIEFARLKSNTIQVAEQVNEGDDLVYGKVQLETDRVPVKTYGGYTQLSVQEIKRSTLPILNRTFEAMSVAAGARKKATLRAFFNSVVAGQVTAGNTVELAADADHLDWADLIVDAAIAYEGKNANFDALVVSPEVFKAFNRLTVSGDRVFKVAQANTLGSLSLPGLTGDLAGVTVIADTGATGQTAAFVNGRAIRQYNNGIVSLQDDNIINLTKTFSVYYFEAIADELPELIVPVEFGA